MGVLDVVERVARAVLEARVRRVDESTLVIEYPYGYRETIAVRGGRATITLCDEANRCSQKTVTVDSLMEAARFLLAEGE